MKTTLITIGIFILAILTILYLLVRSHNKSWNESLRRAAENNICIDPHLGGESTYGCAWFCGLVGAVVILILLIIIFIV